MGSTILDLTNHIQWKYANKSSWMAPIHKGINTNSFSLSFIVLFFRPCSLCSFPHPEEKEEKAVTVASKENKEWWRLIAELVINLICQFNYIARTHHDSGILHLFSPWVFTELSLSNLTCPWWGDKWLLMTCLNPLLPITALKSSSSLLALMQVKSKRIWRKKTKAEVTTFWTISGLVTVVLHCQKPRNLNNLLSAYWDLNSSSFPSID